MDDSDDFPFDSIEDFERAVLTLVDENHDTKKETPFGFAYAPPVNLHEIGREPVLQTSAMAMEEMKRSSSQARSVSATRECLEEMRRVEARLDEKIEQLHSLYFYLADQFKQFEKRNK